MIHRNFEENLPMGLLAVTVLVIFYAVYFLKMLSQKRRGIRTNQIGQRRDRSAHTVEMLMYAATLLIVPVQLVSICLGISHLPASARFSGFTVALVGDAVFLTATLSMRDNWRAGIPKQRETELVTDGIYAWSRNPAFLGFDLMYIGVMIMYFNVLTAVFTAFVIVMLHLQILQEERYMAEAFGDAYLAYKDRTFRYLGRRH